MPTLDKKALDMYTLDSYSLDRHKVDAHKLDGAGGGDPFTKSLLHFNGADGSTTFTDETGRIWTANGNAQIDTAQKVFGTASGLFDGTGDWIDTPASDDFNVGSGDFTVDFRLKVALAGNYYVCGQRDSAADVSSRSFFFQYFNGQMSATVFDGSTPKSISTGAIINDTNWHHIALVRHGNTMTLYIEGNNAGTVDVTGVTVNSSTYKFAIGRCGELASNYLNGWVDEFRFSKGIARWTSNFTPPTKEYAS